MASIPASRWLGRRLDRALAPHLAVAVALLLGVASSLLATLAPLLGDLRYEVTQRNASGEVVVVAIDPPSIQHVGAWPWPRSVYGTLIDKLTALGVTDIALDIDFSSPSSAEQDEAMAAALARTTATVILPVLQQPIAGGGLASNIPLPRLAEHAWLASANIVPDPDGRIRRYPTAHTMDGTVYPSFARQLVGGTANSSDFLIDFGIRAETIPIVSAVDVLADRIDRTKLAGRRVIVGGTALELGDRHAVPRDRVMAGPVIQAVAAESFLQDRLLQPAPAWLWVAGLVTIALLYVAARGSLTRCLIVLLSAAATGEGLAFVLQRELGLLVDTTPWLAASTLYLMIGTVTALGVARLVARVSSHSFDVVAAGIRDGVLHLDKDGTICFANRAAGEIFGVAADSLVGARFSSLIIEGGEAQQLASLAATGAGFTEFEGRCRDRTIALDVSVSLWPAASPYEFSLILRDISERKAEADRQRRIARTDALTGLANRLALVERLAELTDPRAAAQAPPFALLLLDLDGFKEVNDAFGHETGDAALVAFATALAALTAPSDLAARLGGDEFALVVAGDGWRERLNRLTDDYDTLFVTRFFEVGSRKLKLAGSIGAATYPDDGATAGELLANADLALYAAKGTRSRTRSFTRALRRERDRIRAVQGELRRALDRDEFQLFYQPQYDLSSGGLVGAEALIRWQHPERGLLAPGAFMDAVHASDLADEVALYVLKSAFSQAAHWEREGRALRIGVNLSPSLFLLDLPAIVARELDHSGVDPRWIELEVTENILISDASAAGALLGRLRALGVGVAFDDFGTGFASLTHLRSQPIDCIKVDRSFVMDVASDRPAAAIVSSIIQMADAFGMRVIAEGIENGETVSALRLLGCLEGQGYHFGRPQSVADFEAQFAHRSRAA